MLLRTPWLEERNREGGWQEEEPVVLLLLYSLLKRASSPSFQREAFGSFLADVEEEFTRLHSYYLETTQKMNVYL